jgi:potassium efflux system protein
VRGEDITAMTIGYGSRPAAVVLLLAALITATGVTAQTTDVPTAEALQERIAAAAESTELDDADRKRLIELYRQTIGNLEAVRQNEAAAREFQQARDTAPRESERIRAAIAAKRESDPTADLRLPADAGSDVMARRVEEELANLTAVEAKLALLEARLEVEAQRPTAVRQRINAARSQIETLVGQATQQPDREELPQLAEAERWATESRLEALQAEIATLDQELLSYDARNELLVARRDEVALNASRIRARIEALRALGDKRRAEEAEQAMVQARAAMEGAFAGEPLIDEMAEAILELVQRLQKQTDDLAALGERDRALPTANEVETAFRSARRKLELKDSGEPVGAAIMDQRRQFPPARTYELERRKTGRDLTVLGVQLINAEEQRRALRDIPTYVERRIEEAGREDLTPEARRQLEELAATRRSLLDRVISNDTVLQRRLYDYDDTLQRLAERTEAYDKFIVERLFWVRTTKSIDVQAFAALPGELARYLSPSSWWETVRLASLRLVELPILLLAVLVALVLIWQRKSVKAAIVATGETVGRIRQDSMATTFKGLGYTLLLAAPAPLIFMALGAGLFTSAEAGAFPRGVGYALLLTGRWLAFLTVLLVLFMSKGVAQRHFGWSADTLAIVRRQLNFYVAVALPAYFVVRTSLAVDEPHSSGGTLTLLAFVVLMLALLMVVVRLGHPTKGAVRKALAARPNGLWWRWRGIWFTVLVALPVLLIVLTLTGYTYTIVQLVRRVFASIWFLTGVWLLYELVSRWLMLTRRRLALKEALAAREAARARRMAEAQPGDATPAAEGSDEIGAEEIDLVALDADSHKLFNATILLVAILGLAGIWGEVVPALGIFENVQLWSKTALVDGVEQLVPVTLADLLLALVIALGGALLAGNLPSLINIVLLKQGTVSAGGRYTVKTLTQYTITAIAVIVILQLLGANASQLGWAAAALGVGIGFGLQEIVANFICGLILLFERPVRVGDVITVGDASGVVSKIRIRATTIRDWEQKELVIPNKELITGRLLNWTLSDSVTRIQLMIGVAYGSDTDKARALMLEAAHESPYVLKDPEPFAHFEQFGDSTLNLTLRMFTGSTADRLPATTDVNTRIDRKFKDAGIVIAFPQRDVNLYPAGPLTVTRGDAPAPESAG